MPPGSGRKKSSVWIEVEDDPLDSRKVNCKHCGGSVSKKKERIEAHLKKKFFVSPLLKQHSKVLTKLN